MFFFPLLVEFPPLSLPPSPHVAAVKYPIAYVGCVPANDAGGAVVDGVCDAVLALEGGSAIK